MNERFRFTTFYIYFALIIIELVLSFFKEKPPFFSPVNIDAVSIFHFALFGFYRVYVVLRVPLRVLVIESSFGLS